MTRSCILPSPPPGCTVVCYADDTLIGGRDWGEVLARGEVAVRAVMGSIRDAGLKVVAGKTEAIFFHGRAQRAQEPPPANLSLVVGAIRIRVSSQFKYLGLTLDDEWRFTTLPRRSAV